MRNTGRGFLAALALIGLLGSPSTASAISYEDSLDDCSYPKMADLLVMRPLGLGTLAISSVFWAGSAPFSLAAAGNEFGTVTDTLVVEPFNFVFNRPLGECTASELGSY